VAEGPEEISDVGWCGVMGRYLKRIGEAGEIIFDFQSLGLEYIIETSGVIP